MNETTQSTDSNQQAGYWLRPQQVKKMAEATVRESQPFLKNRNETLLWLLYDTGLRVGEAVSLDVEMLLMDDADPYISLPAEIQKDYPTDRTPKPVRLEFHLDETLTSLDRYLSNRWKETQAVFPSKRANRMTTQAVREVVNRAAVAADVRPETVGGTGSPEDVTPHVLRHSLAFRMLEVEDGFTYRDVRNRLRHATIITTERYYDHFRRV